MFKLCNNSNSLLRFDWTRGACLSGWEEPSGRRAEENAVFTSFISPGCFHIFAHTVPHLNSDQPAAIGHISIHTHTHTRTRTLLNKHIHTKRGIRSWGVGGKVPANLGLPVLPLPFFPLTFTCLFFFFSSSLPPPTHTFSALCGGHKLGAVQTVTHVRGMPHIN